MTIIRVLVGAAVLTLGRQLFWVFVGAAGFALGIMFTTRALSGPPDWLVTLIALAAGVLGALLAVFLQQLAILAAGFVMGGYVLLTIVESFELARMPWIWLLFVIGGVIGAVLVRALFDWALILLSSLAGAAMILQSLPFGPLPNFLAFVALLVIGVVVQTSVFRRAAPAKRE